MATFDQLSPEQRAIVELVLPPGEDLRRARGHAEPARAARARARSRRARGARAGERPRRRGGLARPARGLRARPAGRARGHRHEGPSPPLRAGAQLGPLAARLARAVLRERRGAGDPGGRARPRPAPPGRGRRAPATPRRGAALARRRRPDDAPRRLPPRLRSRSLLLVVLVWPVGLLTGDDDDASSADAEPAAENAERRRAGPGRAGRQRPARRASRSCWSGTARGSSWCRRRSSRPAARARATTSGSTTARATRSRSAARSPTSRATTRRSATCPADFKDYRFIDISRQRVAEAADVKHSGDSVLRGPVPKLRKARAPGQPARGARPDRPPAAETGLGQQLARGS